MASLKKKCPKCSSDDWKVADRTHNAKKWGMINATIVCNGCGYTCNDYIWIDKEFVAEEQ